MWLRVSRVAFLASVVLIGARKNLYINRFTRVTSRVFGACRPLSAAAVAMEADIYTFASANYHFSFDNYVVARL